MTVTVSTESSVIDQQLAEARAAIAALPTLERVFFTACGGSYAVMMPNEYFVSSRSTSLETAAFNAAEFTARASRRVNSQSVVILCSHSGTTPETVEAARHARAAGALTVAFTHELGSPLAEAAEYVIAYQHGEGKSEAYVAPSLMLRLVAGLLDDHEGSTHGAAVDAAVASLPSVVPAVKAKYADAADAWGFSYRREELIYTMASGSNYGPAYSFAICLLQEMQWVHSAAIHAGEYFHGPFEITDVDVPFIALLGLDETRAIEERAVKFLTAHSERTLVIDAKDFGLDHLDESVRGIAAHLIFGVVLRTFADALADHRGHPLSVRRYMWRMDY
ncbi:fructosamine deglycase FrlB [Microbacterium mitrae]|uniref:SIS domain-containing protein n=1 Tax=Microbacterium mitrae TaxID=664640 RepID=A0A5C8HKL0_9MICO|nr:SIS domain-containing protein [Microbacterium mitrae]TXK03355.1 SIS domain-containing protein [Microbacterium mitrae]